ncbi:MAG: discoidin domain-containing protein [Armatimonadota bacterium]
MRRITVALLILIVASCAWAQNLVQNADFSAVAEGDADRPEAWVLGDSGWQRIADAGPDGVPVLRCAPAEGRADAAKQWLDYARPDVRYALTVDMRSDGTLRPMARVLSRDTGEEIARVVARPEDGWQRHTVEFATPTANLGVELFADSRHAEGAQAPAGVAEFASVEVAPAGGADGRRGPGVGENLALGKPYDVRPSTYGLCAHADDVTTHLTDGEYTEGHFWTRPGTVGWRSGGPEFITIDLGEVRPIGGAAYSTAAAGNAGVEWPSQILVFVSEDGEQWHRVGDLVALHTAREPLPPTDQYNTEVIWTEELDTHGRFVKLAVFTEGGYIFVDEVEVYRGPDELLAADYTSEPIPDIERYMLNQPVFDLQRGELQAVREAIAKVPAGERAEFTERAKALDAAIQTAAPVDTPGFRAILPMTDVQADIYALRAEVWLAQGKDRVRLWRKNRWDPLGPGEEPTSDATPLVSVEMMQDETRADVLNITSANPRPIRAKLRITGMPGGASPDWITVRQVEHVGSRFIPSVASPLPVADREGDAWMIDVPAGMTRQVWFEIDSSGLEPGTWEGSVEIASVAGGRQSVPLQVTVHPLTMPQEKTLSVGGWDYTDSDSHRGLTPENVDLVIEHLRERGVNSPWALSATLSAGQFDDDGNMVAEPDTGRFDRWVQKWPDSKLYLVFASVGQSFAGAQMGTERFDRQVGQWARFWTEHMTTLGLEPNQLAVLLVDEPRSVEDFETITAWASAIEAAAPEMVIFQDPFIIDDREAMLASFEFTDIICPLRGHYIGHPEWRAMVDEQRERGTDLWFYSCNGPAKTFGPYAYYLAQAWHVYAVGGSGSHFWAFADTRGESTWNDYVMTGSGAFTPIYLDPTSVTAAKPMEAIRESLQDFEYLVMLERLVEERAAAGAADAELAGARRLLATAAERVIGDDPGEYRWDVERDRTAQDRVRHEILQELLALDGR